MNRIIVTANVGGRALHAESRASMQAAAERWGARFVELTEWPIDVSARDPFRAKLHMEQIIASPQVADGRECRVCWLDADVLIRSDAPSVFRVVPEGTLGGVANLQDGLTGVGDYAEWWELAGRDIPGADRPELDLTRYINGGLMVFGYPQHATVWRMARTALTRRRRFHGQRVNPMYEQTAVNVAGAILDCIHPLPATWNRVGAHVWTWPAAELMDCHVFHWANYLGFRGTENKLRRAGEVQWRV